MPSSPCCVLRLRTLEIVDRPKQRQPAIAIRGGQARQVGGVDDQHGMKLEADRPGLNAAHAGKHQRA